MTKINDTHNIESINSIDNPEDIILTNSIQDDLNNLKGINLHEILYEDETIQLTKNFLKIYKYYYPLKNEKIIYLNQIKKIKIFKLSRLTGKYKFFGLNWDLSWYHLDSKRPKKEYGIKINIGSLINIVITPNKTQEVFDFLNKELKKC